MAEWAKHRALTQETGVCIPYRYCLIIVNYDFMLFCIFFLSFLFGLYGFIDSAAEEGDRKQGEREGE